MIPTHNPRTPSSAYPVISLTDSLGMRTHLCWTLLASCAFLALCTSITSPAALAQTNNTARGSRNITPVSHLPIGGVQPSASDASRVPVQQTGHLVIDQSSGRSFMYVARRFRPPGFSVIDISDPTAPKLSYSWSLPGEHSGAEATDITYFVEGGETYAILGFELNTDDSGHGLSAVIFDVTTLPAREVTRIEAQDGAHHLFAYRHSNGRGLLFTTGGNEIRIYDTRALASGQTDVLSSIVLPEGVSKPGYGFYSMFAAFHMDTESDRLYASGGGGYYVFDVTDIGSPSLLTRISSAAVQVGRTIVPTPDGAMVVTTAGYRTAPVRIYDLRPGLDSTVTAVRTAVGAWSSDWNGMFENLSVRWPFVFVASMTDGLQVFNMMNPFEPYTVGFHRTWDGPPGRLSDRMFDRTGAWDVDVRNSDGLIAVADTESGIWLFYMEAFENWDGRGWGLPNISNVQNWSDGPTRSNEWTLEEVSQ